MLGLSPAERNAQLKRGIGYGTNVKQGQNPVTLKIANDLLAGKGTAVPRRNVDPRAMLPGGVASARRPGPVGIRQQLPPSIDTMEISPEAASERQQPAGATPEMLEKYSTPRTSAGGGMESVLKVGPDGKVYGVHVSSRVGHPQSFGRDNELIPNPMSEERIGFSKEKLQSLARKAGRPTTGSYDELMADFQSRNAATQARRAEERSADRAMARDQKVASKKADHQKRLLDELFSGPAGPAIMQSMTPQKHQKMGKDDILLPQDVGPLAGIVGDLLGGGPSGGKSSSGVMEYPDLPADGDVPGGETSTIERYLDIADTNKMLEEGKEDAFLEEMARQGITIGMLEEYQSELESDMNPFNPFNLFGFNDRSPARDRHRDALARILGRSGKGAKSFAETYQPPTTFH